MSRRARKLFVGAAVVIILMVATVFVVSIPRTRQLPNGYVYIHFPRGGHRYIAIDGIKKVGQEVLSYHVDGNLITGRVRTSLGGTEIRPFTLDTKSHVVTLGKPEGE